MKMISAIAQNLAAIFAALWIFSSNSDSCLLVAISLQLVAIKIDINEKK